MARVSALRADVRVFGDRVGIVCARAPEPERAARCAAPPQRDGSGGCHGVHECGQQQGAVERVRAAQEDLDRGRRRGSYDGAERCEGREVHAHPPLTA